MYIHVHVIYTCVPDMFLKDVGEYLQRVGFEFGVTTGRKRRCGWLDMMVVKYSCMINGYTSLNITKLDVLDQLPVIKIATGYLLDGKPLESFPADLNCLDRIQVQYIEVPGWQTDISGCRKYEELPENAKKYIELIEKESGVPGMLKSGKMFLDGKCANMFCDSRMDWCRCKP